MPVSYELFLTMYAASMLVGVLAGLLLTIGWKDLSWKRALYSVRYNLAYIVFIGAMPLLMLVENVLRTEESVREIVYTNWIFNISGNAIRILQDRLDYQVVVDISILVYVWVFTFVLYFTPLLIIAFDDRATLRRYAIAIVFNYLVLLPFYIFFPVTVTGFYADSGLTPYLYIDSNWGRVVTSVDPLNNDFPSGHVSLVVTTLLVIAASGERYKRYSYFLAAASVGIVFAVLYLGVHWLADVFAGFALAIAAAAISGSENVQMGIDRRVRRLSARFLGQKDEAGGAGP